MALGLGPYGPPFSPMERSPPLGGPLGPGPRPSKGPRPRPFRARGALKRARTQAIKKAQAL